MHQSFSTSEASACSLLLFHMAASRRLARCEMSLAIPSLQFFPSLLHPPPPKVCDCCQALRGLARTWPTILDLVLSSVPWALKKGRGWHHHCSHSWAPGAEWHPGEVPSLTQPRWCVHVLVSEQPLHIGLDSAFLIQTLIFSSGSLQTAGEA